jgi:hypothetical protein
MTTLSSLVGFSLATDMPFPDERARGSRSSCPFIFRFNDAMHVRPVDAKKNRRRIRGNGCGGGV